MATRIAEILQFNKFLTNNLFSFHSNNKENNNIEDLEDLEF